LSGAVAWLNVSAPLSHGSSVGATLPERVAREGRPARLLDYGVSTASTSSLKKKLEARFPDELVVIGIHAAKFDYEKAPASRATATECGREAQFYEPGGIRVSGDTLFVPTRPITAFVSWTRKTERRRR
jgi:hypothetical protein